MNDDIKEIAPSTRTGTIEGIEVQFRAYVASDNTERLIWRIGDYTGNYAKLDKIDSLVFLPNGQEITIDGEQKTYFELPRYLSDALMNDFDEFETDAIDEMNDANSGTGYLSRKPSEAEEDDEIDPIFDDIDVVDTSEDNSSN